MSQLVRIRLPHPWLPRSAGRRSPTRRTASGPSARDICWLRRRRVGTFHASSVAACWLSLQRTRTTTAPLQISSRALSAGGVRWAGCWHDSWGRGANSTGAAFRVPTRPRIRGAPPATARSRPVWRGTAGGGAGYGAVGGGAAAPLRGGVGAGGGGGGGAEGRHAALRVGGVSVASTAPPPRHVPRSLPPAGAGRRHRYRRRGRSTRRGDGRV